jgi:choline-sulfatase
MAPNILLIVSDSLPAVFTGPYGDASGATPNLDALAARGAVFETAYCSYPLCAPSRASFLTGRYASQLGCFDNGSPFSSEWPTLAHSLKALGFESMIAGKMHFVGHDQHHGFHHRLALETDYSKGYNPRLFQLAYDWTQPSGGNPDGPRMMGESYVASEAWRDYRLHYDRDEAIHQAALRFLAEPRGLFFACVSYHAPHNPFWIPEELRRPFRERALSLPAWPLSFDPVHGPMDRWLNDFHYVPEFQARMMTPENLRWLYETFYGMLFDLDRRVGELLQAVPADTLVVFISDHGDMMGERGMLQKRYFYEKSVRVPFIVSWPGVWQTGLRIAEVVSLLDLFPTLADALGAPLPEDLPGVSLVPSLAAGRLLPPRDVFAEYHGEGVHAPCFMLRRGDWKYLWVPGHEERLYDLARDPGETRNAVGEHGALAAELRGAVLGAFDPDDIARRALASQRARRFVFACEEAGRA